MPGSCGHNWEAVAEASEVTRINNHNCNHKIVAVYGVFIASFPGLLAPLYVACSTNAGEGLVKLSHVV